MGVAVERGTSPLSLLFPPVGLSLRPAIWTSGPLSAPTGALVFLCSPLYSIFFTDGFSVFDTPQLCESFHRTEAFQALNQAVITFGSFLQIALFPPKKTAPEGQLSLRMASCMACRQLEYMASTCSLFFPPPSRLWNASKSTPIHFKFHLSHYTGKPTTQESARTPNAWNFYARFPPPGHCT
jgi:hypothetical protein